MNAEISQDLLLRLSLEELETEGRKSLDARNFPRAYQLLREASRRAPFRQDLRGLLSLVIEGRIDAEPPARPRDHSALEAMRVDPRSGAASGGGVFRRTRRAGAEPELLETDSEEPAPGAPPSARSARRFKPGQFERRHRRGPLSALFIGGMVGLALLTVVGGAGALYLRRQPGAGAAHDDGGAERARMEQAFAQAETYVNQNSFSLAIARLEPLPPTKERDARLAAIYMKIGDQGFKQDPPRLQAALDAYSKAVQFVPDNPEDGVALAQVYYALAGGRSGDAKSADAKADLDRCRQTLQAVIDRNADHIPAYQMMVKAAIAQRDYTLQQQMLRKIIDYSPKESEAALNARDSLRSLGFKIDN